MDRLALLRFALLRVAFVRCVVCSFCYWYGFQSLRLALSLFDWRLEATDSYIDLVVRLF